MNKHPVNVDKVREQVVQTVPCPVCGAAPGIPCTYVDGLGWWAHTGRYRRAAQLQLVPALPGEPWTS